MDNEQVKKYLESLLNKNYICNGEVCIGYEPAKCAGHEKEINFAIDALERCTPIETHEIKPFGMDWLVDVTCPVCKKINAVTANTIKTFYCGHCGQAIKIDWEDK